MNVTDNALAGDPVKITNPFFTANLSQQATMNVTQLFGSNATFNLSQGSDLHVSGIKPSTLIINISGKDSASFFTNAGGSGTTVHILPSSVWTGSFSGGGITVQGDKDAAFANVGNSGVAGSVDINAE